MAFAAPCALCHYAPRMLNMKTNKTDALRSVLESEVKRFQIHKFIFICFTNPSLFSFSVSSFGRLFNRPVFAYPVLGFVLF